MPVMTQLFAILRRKGGSWPVCGEAKVGAPQHEPFADCPAATRPVAVGQERPIADAGGAWCQRLDAPESERLDPAGAASALVPRERRAEPWFVVLDGPEGPRRFYFAMEQ
jgi:hypothetical protein